MGEGEDNEGSGVNIEMQAKSNSGDKDSAVAKAASATDDKPPKPPKRDYQAEEAETRRSDDDVEYASVKKRKKIVSFPTRPEFVYKPENPEAWMSCLTCSLVVFNLFIWLLGAVVTALGIWIKVDKEFWSIQMNLDVTQFNSASYVLIIAGVVIMLVGFIGCYGAIASKVFMLIIFAIIVIIILLLEIAVMALVWSAASNNSLKEDIKLKATKAMNEMSDNDAKLYFINLIQSKLQCCGVNGPQDYSVDKDNPRPIPNSCTDPTTGTQHERGCYDALVEFLKNKAAIVGGVAVAIFLLQFGALFLTICLICGIKNAGTSAIF